QGRKPSPNHTDTPGGRRGEARSGTADVSSPRRASGAGGGGSGAQPPERKSSNSGTLSPFDPTPTRPAAFSVSSCPGKPAAPLAKRTANSAPLNSTRSVCHARGATVAETP